MTSMEAKLGEDAAVREEKVTEKGMNRDERLRLERALPLWNRPEEQAVFAAAFVQELKESSPRAAYLKAVEVLHAFRQADLRYREGRLDRPPSYR